MAVYRGDSPYLFGMAVRSIFCNSLLPSKLLLVVDGELTTQLESTLSSLSNEYGASLLVKRMTLNCGLAQALNYGLNFVTTEWVVRADSDDFNMPYRFQKMAHFLLKNPNIELFGGNILELDAKGDPVSIKSVPQDHQEIKRLIKYRNPFNHMTVAFKKSEIRKVGGYPAIYLKEDYALWAIAISNGLLTGNMPDILVRASAGMDMINRRGGVKYVKSEFMLQKLLVQLKLNSSFTSILLFFLRSAVFISPSCIRSGVYALFLRKKANKITINMD